jgi:hypothetical protein
MNFSSNAQTQVDETQATSSKIYSKNQLAKFSVAEAAHEKRTKTPTTFLSR